MLEVIEASGLATIQDLGRKGWRRFGVPLSGPMDAFAFQAANLLAGNLSEAAALEIGGGEIELQTDQDCVIAAAGAGYSLSVYTWEFPLWDSCFVRAGWKIRLGKNGSGMWAYLAVAGGLDIAPMLDSRSTYVRGHIGGLEGRLLQEGDQLKIGKPRLPLLELSARTLTEDARPAYQEAPQIAVIPGPQNECFTDESLKTFFSSPYRVSTTSDRMGYRLEGAPLKHSHGADLISEGLTIGSIQVPADGQPIVMMADCATTGGYPKIASVIRSDLPVLAQCTPGKDSVRFSGITLQAAQTKYRVMMEKMRNGIVDS
ncbi:MAG TPA: biotin-dependent carboxyltransferase family protein [Anaerolineales bacterium]|nr:biotin-dependent carboxyltransferase family protein [Anaerolineales bacterium]